jgi:hypothetical protein
MLPNAEKAFIAQSKIEDYLLSPSHSVGTFKHVVFSALGYNQQNWQILRDDILALARIREAFPSQSNGYGQKFIVSGKLVGPNGRSGDFVTVWIVESVNLVPRFLTAYPG